MNPKLFLVILMIILSSFEFGIASGTTIYKTYTYQVPLYVGVATLKIEVTVDNDEWLVDEEHTISFAFEITEYSSDIKEAYFRITEIGIYLISKASESHFRIEKKQGGFVGLIFSYPIPFIKQTFSYSFKSIIPKEKVKQENVLTQIYFYAKYLSEGRAEGTISGGTYKTTWGPSEDFATNQDKEIYITVKRQFTFFELLLSNPYFPLFLIISIGFIASISGIGFFRKRKKRLKEKEKTEITISPSPTKPITIKCSNCGQINVENAKFCKNCGETLINE